MKFILARSSWIQGRSSCNGLHQVSRTITLRLGQHFRKKDIVMVSLIVYCGKRVNALTAGAVGINSRFWEFLKNKEKILNAEITNPQKFQQESFDLKNQSSARAG
jgi:hypothetical protein